MRLVKLNTLKNIVIGLDSANKNEFEKAKFFFQNCHKNMKFYGMMVQT